MKRLIVAIASIVSLICLVASITVSCDAEDTKAMQTMSARNPLVKYYVDTTKSGVNVRMSNNNGASGSWTTYCSLENLNDYSVVVTVEIAACKVGSNGSVGPKKTVVMGTFNLNAKQRIFPLQVENAFKDVQLVEFNVRKM